MRWWTLVGLLLSPLAAADDVASVRYTLDARRSDLYVVIRNDTSAMMSRLGHDHVIYARHFTGAVRWPTRPGGPCSVEISVPVSGLTVDPPGFRDRAGLNDDTISESDKEKLSKNMWGRSQLAADQFPAVTFRSDACPGGTGRVTVPGTLTIRGVARPLSVVMDVRADATSFAASGSFETTHTEFGFKPFAATSFGPRNQDALAFTLSVRGTAPGPTADAARAE